MKENRRELREEQLDNITGGAQARDADVGRATPVGEGDLVTPVLVCPVCKTDSSVGGV